MLITVQWSFATCSNKLTMILRPMNKRLLFVQDFTNLINKYFTNLINNL